MASVNILTLSAQGPFLYVKIWVWKRQILTYKDGPRAERVNPLITTIVVFILFYYQVKSVIMVIGELNECLNSKICKWLDSN